jgi:ATP-dependent DNA ligase
MTDAPPFLPMEAKSVTALPAGGGWQFEPKWDGFRCLAMLDAGGARIYARSGKPLGRFFPEVLANVAALDATGFVLDGELIIGAGGIPSFDYLQMRLHPAESRIKKLAREIPATFVAFDLPRAPGGSSLLASAFTDRRAALEKFLARPPPGIVLSPFTREIADAEQWLDDNGGVLDGIVAKRLDGPYVPEERAMLKVKRQRTADCVVGGFRYGTGSKLVGSLLLGLYNDAGKLDHVGFTSQLKDVEKPALTARLEALGTGPGFTGNAPGGPSRWSTERTEDYVPLPHELVIEAGYDTVTSGRFRHGLKLLRWRPDKAPRQCTYEQMAPAGEPPGPLRIVLDQLSRPA